MKRTPDARHDVPWPETEEPSEAVSNAIRDACTRDLRPQRGLSAGARWVLSLLLPGAVIAIAGGVKALGRHDHALTADALGAAGWGVVQGVALLVGLQAPPGRRIPHLARTSIVVIVPVLFAAHLGLLGSHHLSLHEFLHAHLSGAVDCALQSMLYGAFSAGAILLLWRATDPFTPGLSGALAGMAGGIAGAVAVGLACPDDEVWHRLVGHGLSVVLLPLGGWWAGRRWLTP